MGTAVIVVSNLGMSDVLVFQIRVITKRNDFLLSCNFLSGSSKANVENQHFNNEMTFCDFSFST